MPTGFYKRKLIVIKAKKYNRLTAIKFVKKVKTSQYWLFECDCGVKKIIRASSVGKGHTKSCGCLQREVVKMYCKNNIVHGMVKTKTYRSWSSMKERCLNKSHKSYKDYGGRGITICREWMKFENFYKDMGDRPPKKTLDRINNDKGYFKKNCKWSTSKEQSNNKRNNWILIYNGKAQTIEQWSKELKIIFHIFRNKIQRTNKNIIIINKEIWKIKKKKLSNDL